MNPLALEALVRPYADLYGCTLYIGTFAHELRATSVEMAALEVFAILLKDIGLCRVTWSPHRCTLLLN